MHSGGRSNGGDPGTLVHFFTSRDGGIDLTGGDEVALRGLLSEGEQPLTPGCGLAARGTSVWAAMNVPPGLARVDTDPMSTQTDVVWARRLPRAPDAIAVGYGSVWTVDSSNEEIRRIDQKTGRSARRLRAGRNPVAIAAGAGAVWVANADDDSVSRIDPRTDPVSDSIAVGDGPVAITTDGRAVWVAMSGDGSVERIDARPIASPRGSRWATGRRASPSPAAWSGSPCTRSAVARVSGTRQRATGRGRSPASRGAGPGSRRRGSRARGCR